jgi:hypothetical protein
LYPVSATYRIVFSIGQPWKISLQIANFIHG